MESQRTLQGIFSKWERSKRIKRIALNAGMIIAMVAASLFVPLIFGSDPPWKGRIVGAQTMETPDGPVLLVYRSRFGEIKVQAMVPGALQKRWSQ